MNFLYVASEISAFSIKLSSSCIMLIKYASSVVFSILRNVLIKLAEYILCINYTQLLYNLKAIRSCALQLI